VTGVTGVEGAGYGRVVRFKKPERLGTLLSRIKDTLCLREGLSVAVPQSIRVGSKADMMISSVGICAGSGGSTLKGLDVDMLFTGELSHHEALAAIETGKVVVTTFHSNTERLFLSDCLTPQLLSEISQRTGNSSLDQVATSEVDRDPFEIVQDGQEGW
jgi:putative NIF3 family GTP cyclohydrolase 1 type 2